MQINGADRDAAAGSLSLALRSQEDLVQARENVRRLAGQDGFASSDLAVMTAVISQVGRKMLRHARDTWMQADIIRRGDTCGIRVAIRCRGLNAGEVANALPTPHSVDEFKSELDLDGISTIVITKWSSGHPAQEEGPTLDSNNTVDDHRP